MRLESSEVLLCHSHPHAKCNISFRQKSYNVTYRLLIISCIEALHYMNYFTHLLLHHYCWSISAYAVKWAYISVVLHFFQPVHIHIQDNLHLPSNVETWKKSWKPLKSNQFQYCSQRQIWCLSYFKFHLIQGSHWSADLTWRSRFFICVETKSSWRLASSIAFAVFLTILFWLVHIWSIIFVLLQ